MFVFFVVLVVVAVAVAATLSVNVVSAAAAAVVDVRVWVLLFLFKHVVPLATLMAYPTFQVHPSLSTHSNLQWTSCGGCAQDEDSDETPRKRRVLGGAGCARNGLEPLAPEAAAGCGPAVDEEAWCEGTLRRRASPHNASMESVGRVSSHTLLPPQVASAQQLQSSNACANQESEAMFAVLAVCSTRHTIEHHTDALGMRLLPNDPSKRQGSRWHAVGCNTLEPDAGPA